MARKSSAIPPVASFRRSVYFPNFLGRPSPEAPSPAMATGVAMAVDTRGALDGPRLELEARGAFGVFELVGWPSRPAAPPMLGLLCDGGGRMSAMSPREGETAPLRAEPPDSSRK